MSRFGALAVQWKSLLQANKIPSATHAIGNSILATDNGPKIDFTSGALAVNLGHNNPYIDEGSRDKRGIAYTPIGAFKTQPPVRLAERIIEHLPEGYGKVLFTLGGADANECAVFIAHEYHRLMGNPRHNILSYLCSFHGGSTMISSRLSGDPRCETKRNHYGLTFPEKFGPTIRNPSPGDRGRDSRYHIRQELGGKDVAAFFFEGSPGTSGADNYPAGHLEHTQNVCRETGTLSVCDEVMSGWGRTGSLFAHQQTGIKPDIITTAKGITSGYRPLGAVILRNEVAELFADHPIMNGQTYAAHTDSCAIGNRCMDLYERNNFQIFQEVSDRAVMIYEHCNAMARKYPFIDNFQTNGLLGRFRLNITDETERARLDACISAEGVYCLRLRETLMIGPPLNIPLELIDEACASINRGMQAYIN